VCRAEGAPKAPRKGPCLHTGHLVDLSASPLLGLSASLSTSLHACMHTEINTYVRHTYVHTCKMLTDMHTYLRTCVPVCIHVRGRTHKHTRGYLHACADMCLDACIPLTRGGRRARRPADQLEHHSLERCCTWNDYRRPLRNGLEIWPGCAMLYGRGAI